MAEPQPKAGGPAAPQDLNTEGLRPHAAAEGELVSRSQRRRNKKASGQVPGDDHLEKWAAKYGNGVSHAEASSRESTNPSCSGQGEGEATAAPVLGGKGCPHRRAAVKHLARHNAVRDPLDLQMSVGVSPASDILVDSRCCDTVKRCRVPLHARPPPSLQERLGKVGWARCVATLS